MAEVVPRLGFRLVRIEVGAQPDPEGPGLVWRAWATDDEDEDTVVLGYLRSGNTSAFGQARTAAVVFGRSFNEAPDPTQFELWIRENVLEYLYDLARRAINAQAANMDVALEIPTKAPEVSIARFAAPVEDHNQ